MAQYHNLKADRERSRSLYQRALAVFEGPGARHPNAVGLMNDYASLLGRLNLHAEAEAMQRQAILSDNRSWAWAR